MISKNQLKYYSSLLFKKYRRMEGRFIVEGEKLVKEGLAGKYDCEMIFVTDIYANQNPGLLKKINKKNIPLEKLKSTEFQKLTDTKTPQGIAAVFLERPKTTELAKIRDDFIIYLEDIADPGNLGTILRTSDWFGIKTVILSKDTVELYNPKVIRASMGSVFHLNIIEDITLNKLSIFKSRGYHLVCSDISGTSIYDYKKPGKLILFFCNEAGGPSKKLLKLTDERVTIPGEGKAESLNVASAAAVVLAFLKIDRK